MNKYAHQVAGIFSHRDVARGISQNRLQLIHWNSDLPASSTQEINNKVLKDMAVYGAIGAGIGAGISGLVEVGLIADNVAFFVASPLIAQLALLAWGTSIGATIGAMIGVQLSSENNESWFSDLFNME